MLNNNPEKSLDQITNLKKKQLQIQKLFSFDEKLFQRICYCGKSIAIQTHENIKTLDRLSSFAQPKKCKLRFCPICSFYRVKNLTPQILRELKSLRDQGKELLFLTLTVPNCEYQDLRDTIQRMNKSFAKMITNKQFKNNVTHWIRTLEVTFKKDKAHPHFHNIIAVDKDYFKHKNFLRTKDWSKLWSRCYKSNQGLIVDARGIKQKKGSKKDDITSAVAELSKYIVKSQELTKLDVKDVEVIYNQLTRLRFIVTSRNINLDEEKEESLDKELWILVELIIYKWNLKYKNYKYQRTIKR